VNNRDHWSRQFSRSSREIIISVKSMKIWKSLRLPLSCMSVVVCYFHAVPLFMTTKFPSFCTIVRLLAMWLAFIGKYGNVIRYLQLTRKGTSTFSELPCELRWHGKHSERAVRAASPCLFHTHTINCELLPGFLLGFSFDPEDGGSTFHRNFEGLRRTAQSYISEGSTLHKIITLRTSNSIPVVVNIPWFEDSHSTPVTEGMRRVIWPHAYHLSSVCLSKVNISALYGQMDFDEISVEWERSFWETWS
jgi:hypothetical protein